MPRHPIFCSLVGGAALVASTSGYATDYLTVQQAQTSLAPGAAFAPVEVHLTPEQRKDIERASGVRVGREPISAWKSADGIWFFVDHVIGKHEFIAYACAVGPTGAVLGIEILTYRETYGGEIRNTKWRAQFVGKTKQDPLRLDRDIRNISGATLSCRHVTDGVKRLLATREILTR